MEFFHKKTNFPFMATRKVWYTLSAVLMLVSFASFFVRGLNFAIDFTGGVAVEATFPKDVQTEAVREVVA
jgi:preprotein translocase subunit SecF